MDIPALQARISGWVIRTFGGACLFDLRERAQRVVEEAIELGQAERLSKDDVQRILDRVYSRPVGEPVQETGGLAVCLLAYTYAAGHPFEGTVLQEVVRIESKSVEHFRAKQTEKAAAGTARPPC